MSEHTREDVGAGICDGCGEHKPTLVAFNVAQVACGICICTDCLEENEET